MATFAIPDEHRPVRECPHCGAHAQFERLNRQERIETTPKVKPVTCGELHRAQVIVERCVVCHNLLIWLEWLYGAPAAHTELAYPLVRRPRALSPDVPRELQDAYQEAWQLVPYSERAAAVMARRTLQLALRREGFADRDLYNEIENAKHKVSHRLRTKLHYVRQVGLLGAHPVAAKDETGGEDFGLLVEVEPGEIDALFAALDEFFDEFYVRPKRDERELEALNEKLKKAGKAPIKPSDAPE
jgi:hypothetical protein